MSKTVGLGAGVVGLVIGLTVGVWWPRAIVDPVASPIPSGKSAPSPREEALAAQLQRLEESHRQLVQEHRDLLAAREETPKNETGPSSTEKVETIDGEELAVVFGEWNTDPALRRAEWPVIAQHAADVSRARSSGIGGRQPRAMGALEKKAIRELREHLRRIDAEATTPQLSKHPVVVLNMMATHLIHAGRPFETPQLARIETEGEAYEREVSDLNQRIASGEILTESEKKLRRIQLKRQLVDKVVDDILSRDQWEVLFDPVTKGLLYYDVYQIGGLELERPNSSVFWRNERTGAQEHLELFLGTEWDVPPTELTALAGMIEEWLDRTEQLPVGDHHPTSALHITEVMPCAELHVEFQKRVLDALRHDPEVCRRIIENAVFVVFPSLRVAR